MTRSLPSPDLYRRLALAVVVLLLTPLLLLFPQQNASAAPPPGTVDGLSEATAAASCWEIKQNDAASEDGVYWLWTPDLGAPDQFYCDQTTDGGGWVLIGRGREGWSESSMGSGTSAQVRAPHSGTAAFTPRQLSSRVIEALIGGAPVTSLPDGIRLRRALDQGGTQWQNLTFRLSSPRDTWSWQFYNNQRVGQWRIDGVNGTGGSTTNFGSNSSYRRVTTTAGSAQGWMTGFGYGTNVSGSSSPTSYIWGTSPSMRNPRPFTQVFLRPQITSTDVALTVPAGGTDPVTQAPGVQSFAERTVWGVTGLGNGPNSYEGSNEASAFAEVDGMVFVGGNFTHVQTSSGGANQQAQAYLAAFDLVTGEWISTFRPTFDFQVKSLAAMPGGRLAVGGFFTTVNGAERRGIAVLDAHTGELDPDFTGELVNYLGGGSAVVVRSVDVQDEWLYVGGAFTHSTGGTETGEAYTRAGARFSVVDGTPDRSWNPEFNGSVVDLDASDRGDRVYFAGYFTAAKFNQPDAVQTRKGAALRTSDATAFTWEIPLTSSERSGYQQAVQEVGERIWLGGSEHNLFSYGRDDFTLLSTNIGQRGGDFQAIASDGVTVFGGCHCFDANYSGADSWPDIGTSWTSADRINATGAWSATSGAYDPEFSPETHQRNGAGSWALFVDSTGTLWQGGDFTSSVRSGFIRQWSGGYVRFAPRDTSPPVRPDNLVGQAVGQAVQLTWDGVNGADSYEVLNSGRVMAVTARTAMTVPRVSDDSSFAVRAVDASGNRSASTAPIEVEVPPPGPQDPTFIAAGSSWTYWFDAEGPEAGWETATFDDSAWSSGNAPLGWGHNSLGTTLTSGAPLRPLASFYRMTVDVVDATTVESVLLSTRADDGIVVYVNGTEVLRENVDPGASGPGVYANTAVSAANAVANPVTVSVPGSLFTTGTNTITAEVHSNYRSTPSHSFDLSAVATFGTQPPPVDPEEPDPGVVITAGSSWSYYYGAEPVIADWQQPATDVSSWQSGAAPLGWGQTELGTELVTDAAPRPLTSYHRSEFTLPEEAAGAVSFTTRADDGIVVYINGAEVARQNIDEGSVTANTYANAAPRAPEVVEFTIPVAELEIGSNTIAAEVHSNYRSTPTHSFEMSAELEAAFVPLALSPEADQQSENGSTTQASEATDRAQQAPLDEVPAEPADVDDAESDLEDEAGATGQTEEEPTIEPAPAEEEDLVEEPIDEGGEEKSLAPDGTDESTPLILIREDALWSYDDGDDGITQDWQLPETDVSSWLTGEAPIGWAREGLGTELNAESAPQAVTTYYRTTFLLPDDADGEEVRLTVPADLGVIVYLNGSEVGRINLPDDGVTAATLAGTTDPAPDGREEPAEILVQGADLLTGENTIAVEVHSADPLPGSQSFALEAAMLR